MLEVFSWYAIIFLLGWLALPLSFLIFRRLPDRGYSFSKPLGLLLVALLTWWAGNLGWSFTQITAWGAVVVMGTAVNLLLYTNQRLCQEILAWFTTPHNLKLVALAELVFGAGYLFIINLRSFMPQLDQSEKFFDLAFIQALAVTPTLPAPDPWFGGQPMNYYYGGQLLMAVMIKLSGTTASTAYNIAMGLVYATAAVACYGAGANLVGLAQRSHPPAGALGPASPRASIRAGLVGAAFLMLLGNLAPLRQLLRDGFLTGSVKYAPFYVDWPASARMIYDPMPDGRKLDLLTEYPVYSYLNGDLHAHLLGAPYVALAIAFILNMYVAGRAWAVARPGWRAGPGLLAGSLVLGALAFINGGDFPVYLGLTGMALLLAEGQAGGRWWRIAGRSLAQLVAIGAGIYLIYYWYFFHFTGMLRAQPSEKFKDTPLLGEFSRYLGWVAWPRTFLGEYVLMFGLFLLPVFTLFALKFREWLLQTRRPPERAVPLYVRWFVVFTGLLMVELFVIGAMRFAGDYEARRVSLKSAVLPLLTLVAAVWLLWPGAWKFLRQYPSLAMAGMAGLVLVAVGPLVNFELLGPVSILLGAAGALAWRDWSVSRSNSMGRLDAFVALLVALAAGLTLFCELFYIRDLYENRFNTMFKFWYQVWVLYGLSAVYATWRVLTWRVYSPAGSQPVTAGRERLLNFKPVRQWKPVQYLAAFVGLAPTEQPLTEGGPLYVERETGPASGPGYPLVVERGGPAGLDKAALPARTGLAAWQKLWLGLLGGLVAAALAVPVVACWQYTNGYSNRVGLDGEAWYARELPTEYPAMRWLREYTRERADRRGVVLEANGMNYTWGSRVSTFTGLPTVVGWPFHELQWRGNLPEMEIWEDWLDMHRIYETTDPLRARELLRKHNVRYVFVGQIENGTGREISYEPRYRQYSPEALSKFGSFMKTLYADPANNIYVYGFE